MRPLALSLIPLLSSLAFAPAAGAETASSAAETDIPQTTVAPEHSYSVMLTLFTGMPDTFSLGFGQQEGRRYTEAGIGWGLSGGIELDDGVRATGVAPLSLHGGVGRGTRVAAGAPSGGWRPTWDLYWLVGARAGLDAFPYPLGPDRVYAGPWASLNAKSVRWSEDGRGPTVQVQLGTSTLFGPSKDHLWLGQIAEGRLALGYSW